MPSTERSHEPFRLWPALKEAVRGSQQDYTTGPIGSPKGVFIAMTVAFSSLAVVSAIIFRRGRWKTRKV